MALENMKGSVPEAKSSRLEDAAEVEKPGASDLELTADDAFEPSGGLMAMMRKRQKQKKNKKQENDILSGENPQDKDVTDMTDKVPVEASLDEEYKIQGKKQKGKPIPTNNKTKDDGIEEKGSDGKVLTKAQKEKLKKEREKLRKKENVSSSIPSHLGYPLTLRSIGRKEKEQGTYI